MSQTIYASFTDIEHAEKAAGALLDYGVERNDLSLVVNGDHQQPQEQEVGYVSPIFLGNPATGSATYGIGGTPTYAVPMYAAANTLDDDGAVNATGDSTDRYDGGTPYTTENDGIDTETGEAVAKTGITTTTPEDAEVGAIKGTGYGLGLGILAGIASLIVPGVGLVLGGGALAAALGAAALTTGAGAITGGVVGYLKDQGLPDSDAVRYQNTLGSGGALLAVNIPSGDIDLVTAETVLNKYGATDISSY